MFLSMHQKYFVLAWTLLLACSANAIQYEIIDLGPGDATCISNSGYIGGSFGIWYDGRIIDDSMNVIGINDSGNAIRNVLVSCTPSRSFYRSQGIWTDMGTLGGDDCWVSAINNHNVSVGNSDSLPRQPARPFIYENGVMTDLDTSLTGNHLALDINDNGEVLLRRNQEALIWHNGYQETIPSLGGTWTGGFSINNFGQVVGESYTQDGLESHAFLYDPAYGTQDLGTLGGKESTAWDINNKGQIVGNATFELKGSHRAFLYENGIMIDLNTFVPINSGWLLLESASAINDYGQIIGNGIVKEGSQGHAFLMNPIPEPMTLTLLALGGIMVRRRV